MNIEHLEFILEIYRSNSINKASKKLFISQPRLSLILKSIENELNYPIFIRTNSGIHPTELGLEFIRAAEKIYREYLGIKDLGHRRTDNSNLSISSCYSSLFSHAFFSFKQSHPTKTAKQDIYNEVPHFPDNIIALTSKHNRIAVTYFASSNKNNYRKQAQKHGVELYDLSCRLPIMAVIPKGHPLMGRDSVSYYDLQPYPIVTYDSIDYDVILGAAGFPRKLNIQYVSCRATYYDALRIGNYTSISIHFAPGEAERLGCTCLPIIDADYAVPAYMTPVDILLTERERAFLAFFKNYVTGFAAKIGQGNIASKRAK